MLRWVRKSGHLEELSFRPPAVGHLHLGPGREVRGRMGGLEELGDGSIGRSGGGRG
jgi:hypothetical protein